MKLCVMRGQMRAKTPDGSRLKFVFKGDSAYDYTRTFPCFNCAMMSLGCANPLGKRCMGSDREDKKPEGIWVPETV